MKGTQERYEKARVKVSHGVDVHTACKTSGISVPCYYVYKRKDNRRPDPTANCVDTVDTSPADQSAEIIRLRNLVSIQAEVIKKHLGVTIDSL